MPAKKALNLLAIICGIVIRLLCSFRVLITVSSLSTLSIIFRSRLQVFRLLL